MTRFHVDSSSRTEDVIAYLVDSIVQFKVRKIKINAGRQLAFSF
jgi:hypothetical protein